MTLSPSNRTDAGVDRSAVARCGAATALMGAAVVHSTVVAEHYAGWPLAGTFFVVLELTEVMLALAVCLRWGRTSQAAVLLTSLGTIAIWVLSRTAGMPFGPPEFRHPEVMGAADLSCAALELLAVAFVSPSLLRLEVRREPNQVTRHEAWTSILTVGAVTAGVAITTWGLVPAVGRPPEFGHGAHATQR